MSENRGSTGADLERWRERQRQAAERLDPLASELLAELAGGVGGAGRGTAWEVVATLDQAAWRLYRLLPSANPSPFRYQQLGVRATIDPEGKLVAYQIDNGEEFLALVDTSTEGLRRGLVHLLTKGLPVRESSGPPFARVGRNGLLGRLRRALGRS